MNILLACQKSGYLRELLRASGHNAWTCDTEPAEDGPAAMHYQMDVLHVLAYRQPWDCMIAMPECRDLCGSGLHWNDRGRRGMTPAEAWEATERAYNFATALRDAPIEHVAIENSIGILSTRWGKPSQIVQPYWFGDDASKGTCLWMKNFPLLAPLTTDFIGPRMVCQKCGRTVKWSNNWPRYKSSELRMDCWCGSKMLPRWANQTDSGQNRLGPSPTRSADRARTFPGIARAFAAAVGQIN